MKYVSVSVLAVALSCLAGAAPDDPAVFTVTDQVLRPAEKLPPLGVNNWGRIGAVEWAANNFVANAGNEPIYWRNLHRVTNTDGDWMELDGPGTSWWDLWANGFLSGAKVRLYRLVDAEGNALPVVDGYLDRTNADHVAFLGESQVLPKGSPGFPAGGWVVTTYGDVYPNNYIRNGNLSCTDFNAVENGTAYWYTVVALNANDEASAQSGEASATPGANEDAGPRIVIAEQGDNLPALQAGSGFSFTPKAIGGTPPYTWSYTAPVGAPLTPPQGLTFDTATGALNGTPTATVNNVAFELHVRDAVNATHARRYVFNPSVPAAGSEVPQPPTNVRAEAGDGFVTVSWDASPSSNVAAYRILRAEAPSAEQEQRVYLAEGHPPLAPWDYMVVDKRFGNFDMTGVHPRVRGIGNPADEPNWYWNADLGQVDFSFVPHPEPVPDAMVDPGETCLQVDAGDGEVLLNQYVMIGTDIDGENQWYGYLEPGRQYRAEIWMRQEGLGDGGSVYFNLRPRYNAEPYPNVGVSWTVTGEWQRFQYDFAAPAGDPPAGVWHYGPALRFQGPGTLQFDNFRVYRWDDTDARDAYYTPGPTVFDELLASQPPSGSKGAHRIWFLSRDATMDSILSWYASSQVRPDWSTSVGGTLSMTLPMGLEFDRRTGDTPATRMRPWLVLQHILHGEQDWLNLIEFLAAPYDPATDSPEGKPYAYRRYRQRGVTTTWVEEFPEILIEFGNETWHNGHFEDWLGFHRYNWIHQGGPEYGFFARYLIEVMRGSPYWTSEGLDGKIRFVLGGNYSGAVNGEGNIWGYAEEAMVNCPYATGAGHANYVGPKWETGDASSTVFDDHGVQETLVAFLTNVDANQRIMGEARDYIATHYHDYDIMAYEGGPSGYALPGSAGAEQVETNERYGKSLAMAVASLDAWMRSYAYGWTHQCFFSYGQGSHWNSHTVMLNGFRPSPGWLAYAMRNRFASGDLMTVEEMAVPTYERLPGETYPLAGAYAMHDGGQWSVFVVSRKLDGEHDGHDYGNGYTPVTLNLPFDTAETITLHTLSGDPRQSNRDAMNIDIASQSIAPASLTNGTFVVNENTGGGAEGMPPGSIFVYVFDIGQAGEGEGEGEGEPTEDLAALLRNFAERDSNHDRRLSLPEIHVLTPGFSQAGFDAVDVSGDAGLTVAELLEANGPGILHRADTSGNRAIALDELLRMVQFFNVGAYACAANAGDSEDGFLPQAPAPEDDCMAHDADTDTNWVVAMPELLRVVQLMNSGGYHYCPDDGTVDGFCAGA